MNWKTDTSDKQLRDKLLVSPKSSINVFLTHITIAG